MGFSGKTVLPPRRRPTSPTGQLLAAPPFPAQPKRRPSEEPVTRQTISPVRGAPAAFTVYPPQSSAASSQGDPPDRAAMHAQPAPSVVYGTAAPPPHGVQRRRIDIPELGPIVTERLTQAELHRIVGRTGSIRGSFPAVEEIFAAIDAGEYLPDELASLVTDLEKLLAEPFFDTELYVPLDAEEEAGIKVGIRGELKAAITLRDRYDPENKEAFLKAATEIRSRMKRIQETAVLQENPELEEHIDTLMDAGLTSDPEYGAACAEIREAPQSMDSYVVMKKLIGEYMGREIVGRELGDTVDRVLKSIFILEKRSMTPLFKDGIRSGRIKGTSAVYGYVIGEIDSLFVIIDPLTTKYVPVVLLESKGGALSTQSVAQQTRKEGDRIALVQTDPERYALATRAHANRGPFTDITNRFELSRLEDVEILTSGPTREGLQQYDINLGFDTRTMEKLARYLVFKYS